MDDSPPRTASSPPSRPASTGVWEAEEAFVDPEPIKRPKWGIQIYDTRSDSGKNMKQLKKLALKIYEDTWDERSAMGRETLDRIDLYGLAMPDDTSPAERAERCKAHNVKEITARNETGKGDFYIPRIPCRYPASGQRSILVIDRPQAEWDEPSQGGFLHVQWDPKAEKTKAKGGRSDLDRTVSAERQEDEIRFYRYEYTNQVPGVLQNMRDGVEWFELNYVDTGLLEEELRQAVEKGLEK
ncbi:hypothetical protein N0V84_007059 [Fusarium piperis]|uniref:Uncharacterized protein n=1 Tax=Fusarium piperis TaxID=1435070 RepID=A0A9W8WAN7_9HYPO|nr:hypothetical protein N0V84_007059 [Fusarium piperis]